MQALDTARAEARKNENTTVLKIYTAGLILSAILFAIGLFIGYLSDDIETPAASDRSVQAPKAC